MTLISLTFIIKISMIDGICRPLPGLVPARIIAPSLQWRWLADGECFRQPAVALEALFGRSSRALMAGYTDIHGFLSFEYGCKSCGALSVALFADQGAEAAELISRVALFRVFVPSPPPRLMWIEYGNHMGRSPLFPITTRYLQGNGSGFCPEYSVETVDVLKGRD